MIEIKDKTGNIRCAVEITDKCVFSKTLMEEEYILLSFESDLLIDFAKGDYIDTEFGRFIITDVQKPTLGNDGSYQYEQKFHVEWERLRNRLTFYDRQQGAEKSWKMTQRPEYFLDIICGNIYNAGYGRYTYEIGAELTEMKLVEFDSTNILDALSKLAEAWKTDWWITDRVIHLCKCEFGSPVRLETGNHLSDMQRDDGQDQKYYTRLYAFGSSRNLPKNYRKNSDGSTVIEGVVETRLKLPNGIPYIDAWENIADEDIVEGVEVFEDVYPRRVGTISTISLKEYTDEIADENGNKEYKKWNAIRFTDNGIKFSEDYRLPGQDLRIVFQTGKLAGMDFVVKFNPDGYSEKTNGNWNNQAQVFEIIRNEDYGVALPADDFKPEVGDDYILYGFDIKLVSEQYIPLAEQELLDKALEAIAKASEDKSVYTCPTNPIRCAGYTENGNGQLVFSASDVIDLDMGQSVVLYDSRYFGNGYRLSRIRGFEKRLDNKYNTTYTIGESSVYSRSESISEQVQQLTYQAKNLNSTFGSPIYLVRRYDNTAPTDNNALSSSRAMYEFLNKNIQDRANEKISFARGLEAGNYLEGASGAAIDQNGNAEVESLKVRSYLEVFELLINRISAIEGDIVLTEADTIDRVVHIDGNTYRLYLRSKWDGYFTAQREGAVIRGVINTFAQNAVINHQTGQNLEHEGTDTSNNYYTSWMRINSVNQTNNTIEVSLYQDDQVPAGRNFPPCSEMKIARWGHQTDPKYQSCMILSSSLGRIMHLIKVTKPIIEEGNYGATFGTPPEFLNNKGLHLLDGVDYVYARGLVAQDFIQTDVRGIPISDFVDRGQWKAGELYYCSARNPETGRFETSDVWYYGCKYRCCRNLTDAAPAWGNTDWAMIEGNPNFRIEFAEPEQLYDIDNFNATLTIVATLYNQDITEHILAEDVQWTRYSEDADGVERVNSDIIWGLSRASSGKVLTLSRDDLGIYGYVPKTVKFTATATLRDGTIAQASFEY